MSATLSVASCGSSYDGHTRSSRRPAHHNAHSLAAIFNRSLRRVCACACPLTTSYTLSLLGFFYRERIYRVDFAAGFYAVFGTGGLVVGGRAENMRPCLPREFRVRRLFWRTWTIFGKLAKFGNINEDIPLIPL